jgi:hypothetical protein
MVADIPEDYRVFVFVLPGEANIHIYGGFPDILGSFNSL